METFTFALAKYAGRFQKQAYRLIRFDPDGLLLVKEEGNSVHISYDEIRELVFIGGKAGAGVWAHVLGMGIANRQQDHFLLKWDMGEERLYLELDSRYRHKELYRLFEILYDTEVPFHEQGPDGTILYKGQRKS